MKYLVLYILIIYISIIYSNRINIKNKLESIKQKILRNKKQKSGFLNSLGDERLNMPGSSYLGSSMNLVKGEILNQNVIELTYENKTFQDTWRGKIWYIPNESNAKHEGDGSIESTMFNSSKSYSNYMSTKTGGGMNVTWFIASREATNIEEYTEKLEYFVINTEQYVQVYRLTFNKIPSLLKMSEEFREVIEILPKEYDEELYFDYLIDFFGTHYIKDIKLGGIGRTKTIIKSKYVRKYDEKTVEESAKIEFSWLKANAESKRNTRTESIEYVSESFITASAYGGATETFRMNDWDKWLNSIPQLPRMVDYKVTLICDIITDIDKKNNCLRVIKKYVDDNKRGESNYKEVPDCKSIIISNRIPNNEFEIIGTLSNCGSSTNTIYLIKGPNEQDKCLATYAYVDRSGNLSGKSCRLYSNPVNITSIRSDDINCKYGSERAVYYAVNDKVYSNDWGVVVGDRFDINTTLNSRIELGCSVNGCRAVCTAFGYVYQKRIYV